MKRAKLFIGISWFVVFFANCKKDDEYEPSFTSSGEITCEIGGSTLRGGFPYAIYSTHCTSLNYENEQFIFFLEMDAYSKEKGYYSFEMVCHKEGWPELGKKYKLRNLHGEERVLPFYTDYQIVSIGKKIGFKDKKQDREREMKVYANRVKDGYISFTRIDTIGLGYIEGTFEVETERDKEKYPYVSFTVRATKGTFWSNWLQRGKMVTDGEGFEFICK